MPRPGLCPHPKELRVHLKEKINWNFLQIQPGFPQKQQSNKVWKRPGMINPEIMNRRGQGEENLLQEFHIHSVGSFEMIIFLSYFVSKSIYIHLCLLELFLQRLWFPWNFPGISPDGIWTFLSCLGQQIFYLSFMEVPFALWIPSVLCLSKQKVPHHPLHLIFIT